MAGATAACRAARRRSRPGPAWLGARAATRPGAGAPLMERVTFVVESTGERLGCLLNPETLQISRTAGTRSRPSCTRSPPRTAASHEPPVYTSGRRTQPGLRPLLHVRVARSATHTTH